MLEIHIRHGQATYTSPSGLTELGRQQAAKAGEYIRQNFPEAEWIGIHSTSGRSVETAKALGLSNIQWKAEPRIKEMKYGVDMPVGDALSALTKTKAYRSLDWRSHADGESWREVGERVKAALADIDITYSGVNRIISSHGMAMHMTRFHREGYTEDTFHKIFEAPYKYFLNCQLVIYSDQDPESKAILPGRRWVKSVCPWEEGGFGHDWLECVTSV